MSEWTKRQRAGVALSALVLAALLLAMFPFTLHGRTSSDGEAAPPGLAGEGTAGGEPPASRPDERKAAPDEVGAAAFCHNVTQIPSAECQALVDMYNGTNGSAWVQNTGWLATYACDGYLTHPPQCTGLPGLS